MLPGSLCSTTGDRDIFTLKAPSMSDVESFPVWHLSLLAALISSPVLLHSVGSGEQEHINVGFESFSFSPNKSLPSPSCTPREFKWHRPSSIILFPPNLVAILASYEVSPIPHTIHRIHLKHLLCAWHYSKCFTYIYSCNLHNKLMRKIQFSLLYR